MTAQTKQEELNSKVEVIKRLSLGKFHDNHDDGDLAINDAINGMRELINSEVLSALEELEKYSYTEKTMPPMSVIPLATLQSIKNRYKL